MKTKLVWRDETKRPVLKSTIVSHFAMWAVRQSPYIWPQGLSEGIAEFSAVLGYDDRFIDTTCAGLRKIITDIIVLCETVQSWNTPKKDFGSSYLTLSRFDQPEADNDFIDLSALARNISHSVWLETLYDDGVFEDGGWEKLETMVIEPAPGIPGAVNETI